MSTNSFCTVTLSEWTETEGQRLYCWMNVTTDDYIFCKSGQSFVWLRFCDLGWTEISIPSLVEVFLRGCIWWTLLKNVGAPIRKDQQSIGDRVKEPMNDGEGAVWQHASCLFHYTVPVSERGQMHNSFLSRQTAIHAFRQAVPIGTSVVPRVHVNVSHVALHLSLFHLIAHLPYSLIIVCLSLLPSVAFIIA